ncbi:MAG TPA: GMC family oxidoreductase [Pseudonocardiaceae bacterium]|nr:GMC family oxidoreductase [Pseudonocardiaceae bacterium]
MGDGLGAGQRRVLDRVCALVVPGSADIRPAEYIRARLAGMSAAEEDALHAAIGLLAGVSDERGLAALTDGAAFELVRRLGIEAYYGDFAPPGHTGPTGHDAIGFDTPQTRQLHKDWSFLGEPAPAPSEWDEWDRPDTPAEAEVVVVGSGAGGGVIAAALAERGLDVLLLEAGGFHPAAGHTRFELRARHELWWPIQPATAEEDDRDPVALISGRCVGGSTVTNTKVAMRASASDLDRFHAETGLCGDSGAPFGPVDLAPWYDELEDRLGVRERPDWTPSVHRVNAGFTALGAPLAPVRSYTDHNCSRCGSCLQGCPTNAGRSTLNTFLTPVLRTGKLAMRTRREVTRVRIERGGGRPRVSGVDHRHAGGRTGTVRARLVVLAAGALRTPQILLRSNDFTELGTPSTRLAGQTLGLHPARLVYGLFDEPQDCHRAYPITAHCLARQDEGIVIEATTIQDPVSFAESLVDEDNRPLWGRSLTDTAGAYRHWAGLLVMATDENTGQLDLTTSEDIAVRKRFSASERGRLAEGARFADAALRAAGARRLVHSGLSTTHMQGSVRMGEDPARSVVDGHGQAHDVDGLYVGDGSLLPAVLSVNPSLTIMALAARVADRIAARVRGMATEGGTR